MRYRRVRWFPIVGLVVLLAAASFLVFRVMGSSGDADPPAAAASNDSDGLVSAVTESLVPNAAPIVSGPAPASDATSATILAELNGGVFRISGVVPDAATAVNLVASAMLTYGPTVAYAIEVSPDVAPTDWLGGASRGISLLPMITEGSIYADENGIVLDGMAPDQQYLAAFEQAITTSFGVSDISTNVTVSNLAPPRFNARMQDDVLVLSGVLPSDLIRDYILGGAVAVYGPDKVVDDTTTDESLYTSYWMYTMPDMFALLSPFADYEFDIENGVTSGSLNDGANFESGSSVLDDSTKAVLKAAVAMLNRDPSLGMLIEGHTDNVGSFAFNQRLSEERADAAIRFLVGRGINVTRLAAVGYGESAPATSNATADGRAANRRVVFVFEPLGQTDA